MAQVAVGGAHRSVLVGHRSGFQEEFQVSQDFRTGAGQQSPLLFAGIMANPQGSGRNSNIRERCGSNAYGRIVVAMRMRLLSR